MVGRWRWSGGHRPRNRLLALLGGCPRAGAFQEARQGGLEVARIGTQEDLLWRGIPHFVLALNACGR